MYGYSGRDEYRLSRACYIIEAALEYFISILTTGTYLARITSSLGFSDSLTGILSSFVSLGCVFQLGAIGLFRKSTSVKRAVIACKVVNQLLLALVYLTPVLPLSAAQKMAVFLVCFCSAMVITNLAAPSKSTWLMGMVHDRARGAFTARMEIVSLLGGMVFTYLVGCAIDMLEAAAEQRLSFILGSAAIVVLMLLHTLSLIPAKEKGAETSGGPANLRDLLSNRMYLRVVPVVLLWHVASNCATPFYATYQLKELGFSMTFISVLSIAYSVVRVLVSPALGRYADRNSFSRMVLLCFGVAATGFFVNCFTVPENGKMFYTAYYCLSAVSMAGINSALTNLVYDHVKGDNRRSALAISSALGGLCGFGATCLMSPVVSYIQRGGNRLLGLHVYPAQFVSAIACLITLGLMIYLVRVLIPSEAE